MIGDFFFMDSSDFMDATPRLIGYMVTDDGEYIEDAIPAHPSRTGIFVLIENDGSTVRISQDAMGSYGLYLYRDNGYFALSNSFFVLAEHLAGKLTLDRRYARALVFSKYVPHIDQRTLAQKVQRLRSFEYIEIEGATGKLSVMSREFLFEDIEATSDRGIELIDRWYWRWVALFRDLAGKGFPLRADLSGGFDTRIILSMLVHANIDLTTIEFYSHENVLLPKDTEDLSIAKHIAHDLGIALNEEVYQEKGIGKLEVDESISSVRYSSLPDSIVNKYPSARYEIPVAHIKGIGSTIKGHYFKNLNQAIRETFDRSLSSIFKSNWNGFPVRILQRIGNRLHLGTRNSIAWELDKGVREEWPSILHARGFDEGTSDLIQMSLLCELIICERMDMKKALDFMAGKNERQITPFLDPEIMRIYHCPFKNDIWSLAYLILDRFGGSLSGYPFQARTMNPDMVSFIHAFNEEHPPVLQSFDPISCDTAQQLEKRTLSKQVLSDRIRSQVESGELRTRVEPIVGKTAFEAILKSEDYSNISSLPRHINGLLAIDEFLKLGNSCG